MTEEKVREVYDFYGRAVPFSKRLVFRDALRKAEDYVYEDLVRNTVVKSPTTTLVFSIFLGCFGADRFYIGDIIFGILKLLYGLFVAVYAPFMFVMAGPMWFDIMICVVLGAVWLYDVFRCRARVLVKNYKNLMTWL